MLIVLTAGSAEHAWAAPEVSQVRAWQRGDGSYLVDVYYDLLADPSNSLVTNPSSAVSVVFSSDGGVTWDITPSAGALTGDVGPGILSGAGKHIAGNMAADRPGKYWPQCRVKAR